MNFNPRSPRGERLTTRSNLRLETLFQSTLPARGATDRYFSDHVFAFNFNPRSPRGERQKLIKILVKLLNISIHAPREGSDALPLGAVGGARDFNPRSPRGERPAFLRNSSGKFAFQSTLPARGATCPCARCYYLIRISIHAPREGSDSSHQPCSAAFSYFNPRSPRGERL